MFPKSVTSANFFRKFIYLFLKSRATKLNTTTQLTTFSAEQRVVMSPVSYVNNKYTPERHFAFFAKAQNTMSFQAPLWPPDLLRW